MQYAYITIIQIDKQVVFIVLLQYANITIIQIDKQLALIVLLQYADFTIIQIDKEVALMVLLQYADITLLKKTTLTIYLIILLLFEGKTNRNNHFHVYYFTVIYSWFPIGHLFHQTNCFTI